MYLLSEMCVFAFIFHPWYTPANSILSVSGLGLRMAFCRSRFHHVYTYVYVCMHVHASALRNMYVCIYVCMHVHASAIRTWFKERMVSRCIPNSLRWRKYMHRHRRRHRCLPCAFDTGPRICIYVYHARLPCYRYCCSRYM